MCGAPPGPSSRVLWPTVMFAWQHHTKSVAAKLVLRQSKRLDTWLFRPPSTGEALHSLDGWLSLLNHCRSRQSGGAF